ncbi:MAG: ribonuclease, partial [Hyphomicrobiales bacterium]|nr:ribonuclease [Hyphomicrobiales bacterium]
IEEMPARSGRPRRQYKIQEVIRRRQILLVQVVKEERGNKGAALTTYLSLAGRYSVLMPNTARGGGISRKITDGEDRKRLKEIAQELEVPEGMGVILRTAGASRTKQEVRRDFEYLLRMWESVRELTLQSSAPTLVYEEGSLIKRSIRDLYGKEIDEVVVAGDEAYKEASAYMGMLMPSHVKNVKPWRETQPLFARMGVEAQLDAMFSAQVTLKSGGYIVINQTEALVAIDVNSGRSTREHNIEDTALRTNLEASDEVARQLRLRDLAGLIVVDFIDMEENRNNRAVERRLKEALKNDRARIQVGRISHFGLLEMSRQRMRTGVLEGSSVVCPHCSGAGTVRSTASIALHILRVIEDALIRNAQYNLTVRTRTVVALYILNQKRAHLRDIEERFGVTLTIEADDTLTGSVYHALEHGDLASAPPAAPKQGLVRLDSIARAPEPEEDAEETESEESEEDADEETASASSEDASADGRKRRRRRRRRGRDRDSSGIDPDAPQPSDEALAQLGGDIPGLALAPLSDGEVDDAQAEKEGEDVLAEGESGEGRKRRRPRRGRGGRGERPEGDHAAQPGFRSPYGSWVRSPDHADPDFVQPGAEAQPEVVDLSQIDQPAAHAEPVAEQPRETAPAESAPSFAFEAAQPLPAPTAPEPAQAAPEPVAEQQPAPVLQAPEQAAPEPQPAPAPVRAPEPLPEAAPPAQKRQGWWSRAKAQISGE